MPRRERKPYIPQFFPGDWIFDAVGGCTLAAQGLWLRVMFIMHAADPYGTLLVNGTIPPESWLASRVGVTVDLLRPLMEELRVVGVPSIVGERPEVDRDYGVAKLPIGTVYSRRMIRDKKTRDQWAANGELGGRPAQTKTKPKAKRDAEADANLNGSSSYFILHTSTEEKEDAPLRIERPKNFKGELPAKLLTPSFARTFAAWIDDRKERGKPMTSRAMTLRLMDCAALPDPIGSIVQSIRNGWTDVYEVKDRKDHGTGPGAGKVRRADGTYGEATERGGQTAGSAVALANILQGNEPNVVEIAGAGAFEDFQRFLIGRKILHESQTGGVWKTEKIATNRHRFIGPNIRALAGEWQQSTNNQQSR